MTTPDRSTRQGARALERLAIEQVAWLTTVNPELQPQSSVVWFLWADDEILVYSDKRAPRNDNLPEHPLVAFNLNSSPAGDDVVTMEGRARIDPAGPPATENPAYLAKYQSVLDGYGWTPEYFAGEYPVAVRITPTRWRVG